MKHFLKINLVILPKWQNTRRDNSRKWGIIVNYASQSKNHENYVAVIANPWCHYPSKGGAGAKTTPNFLVMAPQPCMIQHYN